MLPITRWKFPNTNPGAQSLLSGELGVDSIVSQILINRGITTPDEAKKFLFPSLEQLHNPFLMKDMEKGVDRIIEGIFRNEKFVVYGDYDADGITSTVILVKFLRQIHDNITYYIPGRVEEGYGLSKTAIDQFRKDGIRLIITVDCGISNHEEVAYAISSGIDVIVTDHHEVPDIIPDCSAVINPHRPGKSGSGFPFKPLAGVGVAFNLLIALRGKLRNLGFWKNKTYPNLREYLDLVAIGTIGDIVPLIDENRILSKIGLGVLNNTQRVGLKELIAISDMRGSPVSSESAAFRLIPRINAAGRIGSPEDAVELLLTEDRGQATMLAQRLDSYNRDRQVMEKIIFDEILKEIDTTIDINNAYSLVFASHDWHPGIIGVVASKLVERYYRPTILISIQDGIGKGSGRSIVEFNLYGGLEKKCSPLLISYGGHRYAAGISIKEKDIDQFAITLNRAVREEIGDAMMVPETAIDALCNLDEIDYNLVSQIEMLAPFGTMNPEPVLCARGIQISSLTTVGNNHLKMNVNGGHTHYDTIWFNKGHLSALLSGSIADITFIPQINHWNGKSSIQLKMKDAVSAS